MDYQDYIWDLGGTLLDNYKTSTQAFIKTLEEYGLSASHDAVYKKLKESTENAILAFAPQHPDFLSRYKANEAELLAHPIWVEGAQEVLSKIVALGSRNFLVSHRNQQVLDLLAEADLLPLFTEIITSSNGFARKPNPQSLLYLKEKYQLDKALVIGDRHIDIEAGRAAGFDTLLVEENKSLLEIVN
ncbi:HAD-IA family hydrolase [Streptococcus didelphis]|uniref:HAD-IA family hydrolase n=1 Tax=Streptococcus didelphis TaxID=102886 RepID=UPI0003A49CF8|nr:HAD-IA family hydrolase [Streptococcus didelphis]